MTWRRMLFLAWLVLLFGIFFRLWEEFLFRLWDYVADPGLLMRFLAKF